MKIREHLPEALRNLRQRAGLNTMELAEGSGLTVSMIVAYERGPRFPSLPTIEAILGALGTDLFGLANALREVEGTEPVKLDDPKPKEEGDTA